METNYFTYWDCLKEINEFEKTYPFFCPHIDTDAPLETILLEVVREYSELERYHSLVNFVVIIKYIFRKWETSMSRIAIIGEGGKIEREAAIHFNNKGYDVTVVTQEKIYNRIPKHIRVIRADITNRMAMREILHLQNYLFIAVNSESNKKTILPVEQSAILDILRQDYCMHMKRIIYVSNMYAQEDYLVLPSLKTKYAIEQYLQRSSLNYTVFKLGIYYELFEDFIRGNQAIAIGNNTKLFHFYSLHDFILRCELSLLIEETNRNVYYVHGSDKSQTIKEAMNMFFSSRYPHIIVKEKTFLNMKVFNHLFLRGKLQRKIKYMELLDRYGEVGESAVYIDTFNRYKKSY